MLERSSILYSMNRLSIQRRAQIVASLVEGTSVRGTARITGAAKGTVLKLLADVGAACADYQDKALRNLPCRRIQCEEIWSFCFAKEKNLRPELKGRFGYGDVWTWTAICADTKLVPSWLVGYRDAEHARIFLSDLEERLTYRVQLTTDGHNAYLPAVEDVFGSNADYCQLIKLYGKDEESEKRYSPPKCIGTERRKINGEPDPAHVSTSFAERNNLTIRMSMRRFTRLTNAHSKKVENLEHALALHFMYYNFARIHSTLRVTPAMEAGIADHVWELEEILGLICLT